MATISKPRYERGQLRRWQQVSDGVYAVLSYTTDDLWYRCDFNEGTCDCPSFTYRQVACKHMTDLASYLLTLSKGDDDMPDPTPAPATPAPPLEDVEDDDSWAFSFDEDVTVTLEPSRVTVVNSARRVNEDGKIELFFSDRGEGTQVAA